MSRFDFATFAKLAAPLHFRRPAVTFATNSIKLHFQLPGGTNRYIWIDAPWELHRDNRPIFDSLSYPNPHTALGRRSERRWLRGTRRFKPATFLSLTRASDRVAKFRFANGWTIVAPAGFAPRDLEQWYDDWYVSDSTAQPDKSLERTREG